MWLMLLVTCVLLIWLVYVHVWPPYVCVHVCVFSQTKPSCLPPHQARQVLLHWNESSDVCICNVDLSSSAWWNLTLFIILMCRRKEQSANTSSEVLLIRHCEASWADLMKMLSESDTPHFKILSKCLQMWCQFCSAQINGASFAI